MSIRFHPKDLAKKMVPKKAVEKLVSNKLTLNRAAVTTLSRAEILSKETLTDIAIKVIRGYRERFGDERLNASEINDATDNKALMVDRVQNAAVHEISKEVKKVYRGEFYTWLPSKAVIPDPLHQLNYGKKFQLGRGEAPGDRYGCQCGMNILVEETKLEL